jgi:hypothetical protein
MKIKSLIIAALVMLNISTMAHSKEIELALYHAPGGGSDRHSSIMAKSLETQGVTVNKKFFKTCVEALNHVKNSNNAYLFGIATDIQPEASGQCPGLDSYSGVKLYSTVGDMPTMFCTTPTTNNINWNTLQTSNKTIFVGITVTNSTIFELFLKNSKTPLNIKAVPYKGAGGVKQAALAGNIDMMFMGGESAQMVQQGAKCLASSAKTNWADAPFIGDFTNLTDFPETRLQTAMYSNGTVPVDIDKAMKAALSSEQFAADMAENKLGHSGLGAGKNSDTQWKELTDIFKLYASLK